MADGRTMIEMDFHGTILKVYDHKPQDKAAAGPPETGYGLNHFGLETDDIETTVAELKAKGIKFKQEITEVGPTPRMAFFWAPENVLIELMERK